MPAKTVAQKMYMKLGMKAGFFNAPDNINTLLGEIPAGIEIHSALESTDLDFVLGFIEDRAMLKKNLPELAQQIKADGALWLAYHKGTSSVKTDVNRDSINKYGATLGLKGVAMVSIDENWSGFRFKKI